MNKIHQYIRITNIKPEYHILENIINKPSIKRITLNGKELELHYIDEFGAYVEKPYVFTGSFDKKILIINLSES